MSSTAYKRYVLLVLTVVYTMNYTDRVLVMLLLQPIKEDLHLSDTQLGFLTGIAFGLFYATLGLPIARWADRGNRVTITSIAIGLWGVTVAACLLVANFVQLVCARVAAAVGEAGCMPPTYSLLGDYFPEAGERTRAMAIYWVASPLAALIGFSVGGWLNELHGWRFAFFMMGLPALLVSVLVRLTIKEPRAFLQSYQITSDNHRPRLGDVPRMLWQQRSSRHLGAALVLLLTLAQGMNPWFAAFMIRSHGMGTAELGVWLGVLFGFGGIVGIVLGGYAAGRWFADNEQAQMRMTAISVASLVPCFVLFLLVPSKGEALLALLPLVIVFNVFLGPTFALLQRLVEDSVRATTLAVVMLLANLIGMGAGPQIIGTLSDLLAPWLGSDSLRYAMLIMSCVALWTAYHFWQVGKSVAEDLSVISRARHCNSAGGAVVSGGLSGAKGLPG